MSESSGGWVEFKRDWNFIPAKRSMTSVKYKSGHRGRLNAEAYGKALAAGAAVASTDPSQDRKADGGGKA